MAAPKWEETKPTGPSWDETKEVVAPQVVERPYGEGLVPETIKGLVAAAPEPVQKGLYYAGKVADYPMGYLRTGLATLAGTANQARFGKNPVTLEDWKNTLKGNAPPLTEYEDRMGIGEGPSIDEPLFGHDTLRGVGNFGAEMAGGGMLARAAKGVPVLGRAATLGNEATESVGKSIYKSGFKKIDERLLERNAKPLSDVLLEQGAPVGTTKSIAGKVADMAENAGGVRNKLYQEVADKGATIDLSHPLTNAEGVIAKMRKDPGLRAKADQLADLLEKYKSEGRAGVQDVSDWKTNLYDSLPEWAYDANGNVRGHAADFQKALAQDFKEAIEGAGNTARPGLGDEIAGVNRDWGSLIGSKKPLAMQIRRGNTTNVVSPVDAALGFLHPGAEVLKKGADIAKTTGARTLVGRGLIDLGRSGTAQVLADKGLLGIVPDYLKADDSAPEMDDEKLKLTKRASASAK